MDNFLAGGIYSSVQQAHELIMFDGEQENDLESKELESIKIQQRYSRLLCDQIGMSVKPSQLYMRLTRGSEICADTTNKLIQNKNYFEKIYNFFQ